jgi:hypothetical protein
MINQYEIRDGHVAVVLKRRKGRPPLLALVDAADIDVAAAIPGSWAAQWHKNVQNYYAVSNCFHRVNGVRTRIKGQCHYMHALIMQPPANTEVDHVQRAEHLRQ